MFLLNYSYLKEENEYVKKHGFFSQLQLYVKILYAFKIG